MRERDRSMILSLIYFRPMSSLLKIFLLCLFTIAAIGAQAQAVVPFVEHWDSLKTIKKSEGLFVSGREWGEWSFFDRQGRLIEKAHFKAGDRDGKVQTYYDNGQLQHEGFFKRGVEDSVRTS